MKFGVVTSFGSVHEYVLMAREAEAAGWDGVFVWDDISVDRDGVFDPWVLLGAMAAVTERVTLGAMVFSLARRRRGRSLAKRSPSTTCQTDGSCCRLD